MSLSDTLRECATDWNWSEEDRMEVCLDLPPSKRSKPFRPGLRITGTPWVVVRPLGRGGVGEVFEVEHALLGKKAAFKILRDDNLFRLGLADRMAREGRLLASVRHANVVDVFDMGVLDDGRPFVVLELLDGRDLRAELSRMGVLSIPAALEIVTQVLRGLSALHEAGIVHRDIKLENLFLCADGHVDVLDLGAAERMGEECGERVPSLGTPRTMAPEQYEGKSVDGRADLYAVGIVLYELLTGRGPFDDVSGFEALRFAHCHRPPPHPSHASLQFVPPEVDALVMRALAKSPNDRFISADAMALEIAALRGASLSASLPACSASKERVSDPPLTSVTVRSPWTMHDAWPSLAHLLRRILSPAWLLVIAMLALIIASVALGVAVGERLSCAAVQVDERWRAHENSFNKLDPKLCEAV